jgi:hypothetical protein
LHGRGRAIGARREGFEQRRIQAERREAHGRPFG